MNTLESRLELISSQVNFFCYLYFSLDLISEWTCSTVFSQTLSNLFSRCCRVYMCQYFVQRRSACSALIEVLLLLCFSKRTSLTPPSPPFHFLLSISLYLHCLTSYCEYHISHYTKYMCIYICKNGYSMYQLTTADISSLSSLSKQNNNNNNNPCRPILMFRGTAVPL